MKTKDDILKDYQEHLDSDCSPFVYTKIEYQKKAILFDVGKIIDRTAKEIFDEIENKSNLWKTSDIRGSSETKPDDKWLSMNIVRKIKRRLLK